MAYIDSVWHYQMTVVETREFQQRASKRMSDAERDAFITFIAERPDVGEVMVGTGGVRKVRWAIGSRGKSGGVRVIYYYHSHQFPIFLLTVFAKKEKANLSQKEKNEIKQLTRLLVETYSERRNT